MPLMDLGNWIITSVQGLYGWAIDSGVGVVSYLAPIGKALIGQ